ncbi:MAG: hypothetical protein ACKPE3_03935 [Sphaerospermopsis kisseleviana]
MFPVPNHQSPVPSHQSPVTSHQSSVTSPQISEDQKLEIIELLGLGDILKNPYDLHYLNSHIGILRLKEHKSQIESALKLKLNLSDPKYICREVNKIIRGMGHKIENKQINKTETYWVVQP